MDRDRLISLLEGFPGKRVVVVGDCMLDADIWGKPSRISPQAPVMVAEAGRRAKEAGRLVVANPKPASAAYYRGVDLISVNQSEAEAIAGISLSDAASLAAAGERLRAACGCRAAFITRGAHGIVVFD